MWAARLWGAAEVLREMIGEPLSPVEQASYESAIKNAHRRLGERAFAAAWAQGRTMTPYQTLQAQLPPTAHPPSSSTPVAGGRPIAYLAGLTTREVVSKRGPRSGKNSTGQCLGRSTLFSSRDGSGRRTWSDGA